jgi:hypothetical protein
MIARYEAHPDESAAITKAPKQIRFTTSATLPNKKPATKRALEKD